MLKHLLYISLLLVSSAIYAQDPDSLNANHLFEQQIEGISEKTLANKDFSEIAENLDFLRSHKINLNSASGDELKQLPILDIFQINNLLKYRKRNGEFFSLFELTSIQGFDKEIVRSITPFIEIKPITKTSRSFKNIFKYSNHQLLSRFQTILQDPAGYLPKNDSVSKKYNGEKYKLYNKYLFTAGNKVRFGFTVEKDSGEKFGDVNTTLGWDFASFHLEVKDIGFVDKVILGDYHLEFGQGLAVWSSFSTNKSTEATNIVKLGRGIAAFTGVNENLFFRGATAQMNFGGLRVSPFYSYNKIDASISLVGDIDEFNTYETGLHRTEKEIGRKNTLTKIDYGADVSYTLNSLNFGITAINTTYDNNLAGGEKDYQFFNFDSKTQSIISGHYIWNLNTFILSGEHSTSNNGAWATIHNISVNPAPEFSFILSYRNYQKEYFASTSAPFSEYSSPGEKAYYFGVKSELHKYLSISAYIDIFEKTWLQYQKDAPTKGFETLLQFDTQINRSSSAYFRLKYEQKQRNVNNEYNLLNQLENETKINLRAHFNKIVNRNLRLASRVEVVKYTHDTSEIGWLIFQDIKWKFDNTPLSIYARVAFFDISSWDSRIYAYENDISYIFSVPAYYNKGTRYYLGASYKINRNFSFWGRISLTDFENVDNIGSGDEEIMGNQKAEIKLQLRIKL